MKMTIKNIRSLNYVMSISLFLTLAITGTSLAQMVNPHEIYDLRPGVERYYTPCVPIPDWITCGLSYFVYQVDRVLGTKELNGHVYAEIERRNITNERWITSRQFIYQRIEGDLLIQWQDSESSPDEIVLYRLDFAIGDTVRHYSHNDSDHPIYNQSVITADTTVTFPDDEPYRVVFGSDGTYPWDNARLVDELSVDWSNTLVHRGTEGWDAVGLNWLVPFANMNGANNNPPFYVGIQTFYHVSRFGPILSMSFTGWRYLAGFKSHDGQMYGYIPNGIPVGIEQNETVVVGEFRLLGNYPNPFNPTTILGFELFRTSEVRLEVYDMLGRRIDLLIDEALQSGIHEVEFDASKLSSGTYMYRLIVSRNGASKSTVVSATGKMLLIK